MPRASWRGFLRLSLVSCPIYLSPATTRTKPIRLHQMWRQHRPIPRGRPAGGEERSKIGARKAGGSRCDEVRVHQEPDAWQPGSRSGLRSRNQRRNREGRGCQRIRIQRGQYLTFTAGRVEGARCREHKDRRPGEVGTPQRRRSGLPRQPLLPLSRWSDGGRGAPGDRRGNGRGQCRRDRAPYPQPARADGHGRAARCRGGAVHFARRRGGSGCAIRHRRG